MDQAGPIEGVRHLEGRVHFIPNGEIKSVTNRTYHWGRAVLEIPVRYDENVDRVIETLSEVAAGLPPIPTGLSGSRRIRS